MRNETNSAALGVDANAVSVSEVDPALDSLGCVWNGHTHI